MVPIDGSFTMGVPLMVDVIKQIEPKVVLPMHYWGRRQLDRFMGLLAPLEPDFVWPDKHTIEVVQGRAAGETDGDRRRRRRRRLIS